LTKEAAIPKNQNQMKEKEKEKKKFKPILSGTVVSPQSVKDR